MWKFLFLKLKKNVIHLNLKIEDQILWFIFEFNNWMNDFHNNLFLQHISKFFSLEIIPMSFQADYQKLVNLNAMLHFFSFFRCWPFSLHFLFIKLHKTSCLVCYLEFPSFIIFDYSVPKFLSYLRHHKLIIYYLS